MEPISDNLSPAVRKIINLNPSACTALVVTGSGNAAAKALVAALSEKDIFLSDSHKAAEDRRAIMAGLWLWHDWLQESHEISQSLNSTTGSFWHAILHRREGDFSNSKYWYARAAGHPVMTVLTHQAGSILHQAPADKSLLRLIASGWNPSAMVDLVQAIHEHPDDPRHGLAVRLQQLEWKILFDHCARP